MFFPFVPLQNKVWLKKKKKESKTKNQPSSIIRFCCCLCCFIDSLSAFGSSFVSQKSYQRMSDHNKRMCAVCPLYSKKSSQIFYFVFAISDCIRFGLVDSVRSHQYYYGKLFREDIFRFHFIINTCYCCNNNTKNVCECLMFALFLVEKGPSIITTRNRCIQSTGKIQVRVKWNEYHQFIYILYKL